MKRSLVVLGLLGCWPLSASAQPKPEAIVQYFETSWVEVTARLPEIAAAGYTSVWLPPPTKGAEGTADVGFSVFDRFDLGDQDQRGTVATKYGTKAELLTMVREAHRLGLKVYFDTVMNHSANPAKIENAGVTLDPVPIDGFPGTHPLDYHVLPARDVGNGNWEVRWPQLLGGGTRTLSPDLGANENFVANIPMPSGTNVPGYTHLVRAPWFSFNGPTQAEEQYLSLLGLIDFANEQLVTPSGPAANDGTNLIAELPLPRYVRHPNNPEYYPGGTPVAEDAREYLIRWIKWFGEETGADGLRLDAIKHTPTQFFGVDFPGDPIAFDQAYQDVYDQVRGQTDTNDDDGVQDALLFGESFTGDFGSLLAYRATGMYLLDFPLLFKIGDSGGIFSQGGGGDLGQLSFPQGGMTGADVEFGGLGRTAGVSFVQSHDTNAPTQQANGAYAFVLTRVGHAVVFYDGNNYSSATFVKPGRPDALGELSSDTITTLLDARRRFARGGMFNRFVDGDYYVYERVVPTSNGVGGATMLVALTDNTGGEGRFGEFDPRPLLVTEFPPGTVLEELTGHGAVPELTVIDPAVVPQAARDRALAEYDRSSDFPPPIGYGLVYLQVPAGPDQGYVLYAPKTPPATLSLSAGGAPLATRVIETAPPRLLPSGASVPASVVQPQVVPTGAPITLTLESDGTGSAAYFRVDGAAALPGLTPATGTPDGLYDGDFAMTASGTGFVAADLDLSGLGPGVHLVTARVVRAGTPSFYRQAHAYVVVGNEPLPDGGVVVDAGPGADAGGPTEDAGPADSGVDPDPDPDRDGIPSATDVCPTVADRLQADFDQDGVGDACDLCPETVAGSNVDSSGCGAVSPDLDQALEAIVRLILEESYDVASDVDGDRTIDAVDFARRLVGGGR
ncbi:MAG: hypothetical protein IPG45_36000 [Deltaproteobacteria bacterium]|nr:hypothetical protein [Deltaproteobacteria bacterium]